MGKQRWIVGYDFSEHAEAALAHAVRALGAGGGELILVYAREEAASRLRRELASYSKAFEELDGANDVLRNALANRLGEKAAALADEYPALSVHVEIDIGDPVELILSAAKRHKADQIVMGTRGLRGLKTVFVGSVTKHVLREAPVPVLVIRSDEAAAPEAAPAAVEPRGGASEPSEPSEP